MKKPKNPIPLQQLLAQIIAIERMETGKLSSYTPPGRSPDSGPYHKLQCGVEGKNCTRHVRPEELTAVREALEGYQRFKELNGNVEILVSESRRRIEPV